MYRSPDPTILDYRFKKKCPIFNYKINHLFLSIFTDEDLSDGSTDGPPLPNFTEAGLDEMLGSDKEDVMEVEVEDKEEEVVHNSSKPYTDSISIANSDPFHSIKSSYGGPASQRTVSTAYKAVRSAKLAALTS